MNVIGRGRAAARGRGIFVPDKSAPLRKPGEFESISDDGIIMNNIRNMSMKTMTESILKTKLKTLDSCKPEEVDSYVMAIKDYVKFAVKSDSDPNEIVDAIHQYCLISRKNSHLGAKLCQQLADIDVGTSNFRALIFRRIQSSYEENENAKVMQEKQLMNTAFLCECFFHMRDSSGNCFAFLALPIINCFVKLLNGGSEKAIALIAEHLQNIFRDLKKHEPKAFNELLLKIKEKIICQDVGPSGRSILLKILELIWTDGNALDDGTENFYKHSISSYESFCGKL